MSFITEVKNKDLRNSYVLTKTSLLTETNAPWVTKLQADYSKGNNGEFNNIDRISTSLLNAAFTQQRTVFLISRDSLRELVNSDKNHKKKPTFGNKYYPKVIKLVCNGGLLKELVKGEGRRAGVYEVVLPSVLKFMPKEVTEQREQLMEAYLSYGQVRGQKVDLNLDSEYDNDHDYVTEDKIESEPDHEEGSDSAIDSEDKFKSDSLNSTDNHRCHTSSPLPSVDTTGPVMTQNEDNGFPKLKVTFRYLHETDEEYLKRKGLSEEEITTQIQSWEKERAETKEVDETDSDHRRKQLYFLGR